MLLEPGAGHAVGVQGGVEALHHVALQVEGAAHLPVLDALHGGGHGPEDAQPVAGEGVPAALQVGELQAEGPRQVVVQEGGGWCLHVWGHQHGEGPSFATQNELVIVITVSVLCSQVVVDVGCWCWTHRCCSVVELFWNRRLEEFCRCLAGLISHSILNLHENNQLSR